MTAEQIRQGLHNIKTRAATIDQVSLQGEAMVDILLPLLQDRSEGVRWSTIQILSDIGSLRAIGGLVSLLEQSKNASDAAYALTEITGQELGDDAAAWRRWAVKQDGVRDTIGSGMLSDQELIAASTSGLSANVVGSGKAYSVTVSLEDGRSQQIWIDLAKQDAEGNPLVQLITPCGKADAALFESALKLNMTLPHGAIALADLDETLCFAMVSSHLRATVHPEDIAESIMSLAQNGDSLEASISQEDRY